LPDGCQPGENNTYCWDNVKLGKSGETSVSSTYIWTLYGVPDGANAVQILEDNVGPMPPGVCLSNGCLLDQSWSGSEILFYSRTQCTPTICPDAFA
jgi:hypothetical protein